MRLARPETHLARTTARATRRRGRPRGQAYARPCPSSAIKAVDPFTLDPSVAAITRRHQRPQRRAAAAGRGRAEEEEEVSSSPGVCQELGPPATGVASGDRTDSDARAGRPNGAPGGQRGERVMQGITESCSICSRTFEVQFRYQIEERDGGFVFFCSQACQSKQARAARETGEGVHVRRVRQALRRRAGVAGGQGEGGATSTPDPTRAGRRCSRIGRSTIASALEFSWPRPSRSPAPPAPSRGDAPPRRRRPPALLRAPVTSTDPPAAAHSRARAAWRSSITRGARARPRPR